MDTQPFHRDQIIDLEAYRRYGHEFTKPVRYGVDWTRFFAWSLTIALGLSFWACVFIVALWWRG